MPLTKCSNFTCNQYIDTDKTIIRCCDAFVCCLLCSKERYRYIKTIDPSMRFSHAWQDKKVKINQYGASAISRKQVSPIYNIKKPIQQIKDNFNHNMDFTFENDADDEYNSDTTIVSGLASWAKICTTNIFKSIMSAK